MELRRFFFRWDISGHSGTSPWMAASKTAGPVLRWGDDFFVSGIFGHSRTRPPFGPKYLRLRTAPNARRSTRPLGLHCTAAALLCGGKMAGFSITPAAPGCAGRWRERLFSRRTRRMDRQCRTSRTVPLISGDSPAYCGSSRADLGFLHATTIAQCPRRPDLSRPESRQLPHGHLHQAGETFEAFTTSCWKEARRHDLICASLATSSWTITGIWRYGPAAMATCRYSCNGSVPPV